MQLSLLGPLLALPLALAAAPTVVKVGDDSSLTFSPSILTVPVGGVIEFHFYPIKHSVAQGTFEDPCKPLSNSSFWSGAFATTDPKGNATTFSITVKDDQPIYFYCAFPSHCGAGMIGIVNAPSSGGYGGYSGSPEPASGATATSGAEKVGVWGAGLFAVLIA